MKESDRPVVTEHLAELVLRGRAEGTIAARGYILARLSRRLPAGLLAATAAELYAWRASLRVSDASVRHYVSHARNFYVWARRTGRRVDDPTLDLPVPPHRRRLPRPAGEDDLALALASAPRRVRPWLVLAAFEGLRAKEIAYLRREMILDTATPPLLLVDTGAAKGGRERTVPLHPLTLAALRAVSLPRCGWVFTRADGQPGPNAPHVISQVANQHLHGCGLAITLHQLRHRFGTQTYRASKDLRVVQELLGHASPTTTAGYTAFDGADALAAVAALPVPGLPAPTPTPTPAPVPAAVPADQRRVAGALRQDWWCQ